MVSPPQAGGGGPGAAPPPPPAERLAPGREAMRAAIMGGLPTIGICLGMQLLFDGSDEGEGEGLGVIPGRVTRLRAMRVPQIGWNALEMVPGDSLFVAAPLPMVYYANSFVCRPVSTSVVTAWTEHEGDRFPAAVRTGQAVGVQFHPEKSSTQGVRFLRALLDDARLIEGR
ncbi:MAG: imidazole glycerol phosphate synthase subunit HisH [Gemmatimonadaceae bacterium]|nr:imidazole glycerol phosphate synthase subunit HisH [Gemmatimonadaceae bacterium]